MQFNVRNGPVTTWQLVSNSYVYGRRPAYYDHQTARHPSIYDDFDAIMAAAHLLSADGAGYTLDFSAWYAAYDYYGHDATGVTYADQVLARAIGWSQHGFCINCGGETRLLGAVQAQEDRQVVDEPFLLAIRSASIGIERRRRHGRAYRCSPRSKRPNTPKVSAARAHTRARTYARARAQHVRRGVARERSPLRATRPRLPRASARRRRDRSRWRSRRAAAG